MLPNLKMDVQCLLRPGLNPWKEKSDTLTAYLWWVGLLINILVKWHVHDLFEIINLDFLIYFS